MKNRSRVIPLVLGILLLAAHGFAQSQATTAQVSGRVTDSQGAALPGATVTVTGPATGYTRSVTTSGEGYYTAPLIPPGRYEVTVEMSGFGTPKRTVDLTVGASLTLNFTLQVAGVQEEVTVVGETPQVETTSTVRTSTLDSEAIQNLPINGRRFQDFITLTPTVQVDPQRGQLSFSGQRGINGNVSIDGADWNQPFFGGIRGGERANNAFTVPQEAIQEFQVVAAGYSAEFGRSSGGLVNAITKSGTNAFRGSAFYVNRNRDLAEKNAFDQTAAPTQQQFGASLGGPLKKDKLFFFLASEVQKFENTRNVVFDRLAGFSPAAAGREAFDFYKSLETPFDTTNDAFTILGRLDYQFNANHRLSVRFSHSDNKALNANATGNALADTTVSALSNNGTEKDNTNVIVGQLTSVLSPGLLLEARGQYAREERPRLANEEAPTVQTAIGNFGSVRFLPTTQSDWRAQAAANLTWLSGAHTVKGGIEYNHVYVDQLFGFNQFGFFNVSGSSTATILDLMGTGGTIANRFDSRDVTYQRQLGNLTLDFATDEMALFVQDTWRVRPNFTLNYGVRWEGAWNPTPEANNDFMIDAIRGVNFPIGRTVDPTQIPDQLAQFGPRVGFAWDPSKDSKTAVRGYAGVYYARTPALVYAGPMNNFRVPPGDLSVQLPFRVSAGDPRDTVYDQLLLIGIDLNRTPLGQLPVVNPDDIARIAAALGLSVNPFFGAQPILVDKDFKNPRAYHFGLGGERQVADGLTLGVEGTVVKTERLQRNREMNLPAPVVRASDPAQRPFFGQTTGTPRPVTALGSVQVRESTARSLFRAITVSAKLRKTWGQVNAYYVLSKSESDDDNERDSGGVGAENNFNLDPEYGPARLDRRHQFNGSFVMFLPAGFDFSSGFRFLSGLPIDAGIGFDANGDRGGPDRPYSAPGVPFVRNSFRNEPFKELNLRLQKRFKIGGNGHEVILSAEAFNVFNWDNIQLSGSAVTNYCASPAPADCGFGPPTNPNFLSLTDQNPSSSRFGQLLLNNNPGAPRQVQFGIRYQF